ncbi:GyrI-like domain-containing protein [Paenibacillus eucommiae]|uniref:Transcriptional regulator YdeE n=1 Tax=Paenibacillus eucommiae TaxID=1355755 RepID=A0ABS4IPW8_9BACL|nr:effector binding domain-containing protein [Paenibacillus eucommiae]MBP1989570.1 putative transcriptional regulator YdeE [Paenibacillus eucommiae]
MSQIATFECEVITREYNLIGQSITANFPNSFPDAAIKIHTEFGSRKAEIKGAENYEIIFSPYMCNNIVATYFACLEVSDIGHIPDGMLSINFPKTEYAKISCSNKTIGDGYSKIFEWINLKGYKQKNSSSSSAIEVFYYEDNVDEEKVEILIPIE